LVLALGSVPFAVVALVVGLGLVAWFLQCLCDWLVVVGLLSLCSLLGGVCISIYLDMLKFC
jgi:hypothetical protein